METMAMLPSIMILISVALMVVVIFKYLNLSPVLGYLVAGATIGENGFNLVTHDNTSGLGNLGVVFLLFAIGLELSFERLKAMRKYVLGLGSLQVILTSIVIFLIVILYKPGQYENAILIGGGLALSSTAIVLQVIAENKSESSQVGRTSLAILLQQDFSVVPLLVMTSILAGETNHSVLYLFMQAIIKAIIALCSIFIFGRILLKPLFRIISSLSEGSSELFVATTLFVVLTAAWCTEYLGLSLALGAFVSGVLVAETEFRIQAEESIAPFKGILLGLFFMSVGMKIDILEIYNHINIILSLSLGLIIIKSAMITLLCLMFGFNIGTSIHNGLLLSQGGEFAFILFDLGITNKLINPHEGKILLLIVTFTMAITPLLSLLGQKISTTLNKSKQPKLSNIEIIKREAEDLHNHVIIAGFGEIGKTVARMLRAEGINHILVDINIEKVKSNHEGYPVFQGDISEVEILKASGAERAKIIIIAIDNVITTKKSVKIIADNFPLLAIIAQSKKLNNIKELYQLGASSVLPTIYEYGLELGTASLQALGINQQEINRIKDQFRSSYYELEKEVTNHETNK